MCFLLRFSRFVIVSPYNQTSKNLTCCLTNSLSSGSTCSLSSLWGKKSIRFWTFQFSKNVKVAKLKWTKVMPTCPCPSQQNSVYAISIFTRKTLSPLSVENIPVLAEDNLLIIIKCSHELITSLKCSLSQRVKSCSWNLIFWCYHRKSKSLLAFVLTQRVWLSVPWCFLHVSLLVEF